MENKQSIGRTWHCLSCRSRCKKKLKKKKKIEHRCKEFWMQRCTWHQEMHLSKCNVKCNKAGTAGKLVSVFLNSSIFQKDRKWESRNYWKFASWQRDRDWGVQRGYDNGANMSGKVRGVPAQILKKRNPASFSLCAAESSPEVATFFGSINHLSAFLSASPEQWAMGLLQGENGALCTAFLIAAGVQG